MICIFYISFAEPSLHDCQKFNYKRRLKRFHDDQILIQPERSFLLALIFLNNKLTCMSFTHISFLRKTLDLNEKSRMNYPRWSWITSQLQSFQRRYFLKNGTVLLRGSRQTCAQDGQQWKELQRLLRVQWRRIELR